MKGIKRKMSTMLTKQVELDYLLYLPEVHPHAAAGPPPLLLFLHGAGERGSDINLVKPWLNAGTYYFWVQKAGYVFPIPDTEVVS